MPSRLTCSRPSCCSAEADRRQTRGCLQITQQRQDQTPGCCLLGQGWLCVAGTQLSGTHCLGTQPGEPCLAEMDAPQQLCSRVFFLVLAWQNSHLAEGERGDVRNQALSSCSSRPTSGSLMLPWQTALATGLLELLFLVSGSSRRNVVPRTLEKVLPWLFGAWGGPASMLQVIPGHSIPCSKHLQTPPTPTPRSRICRSKLLGVASNAYPSVHPCIHPCIHASVYSSGTVGLATVYPVHKAEQHSILNIDPGIRCS